MYSSYFVISVHKILQLSNFQGALMPESNSPLSPAMDENYADLIFNYSASQSLLEELLANYNITIINTTYAVIHISLEEFSDLELNSSNYVSIPKCLAPMDTQSLNASGITRLHNHPYIPLRGKDVAVAIIDSGIDYTNELFRNSDGSSRIAYLWDQTLVSDHPPAQFNYGTEYTKEDIDNALFSDNPFELVPSIDREGHGTFISGIAAGGENISEEFMGAAPEATLIVVKLKPAKKYLRQYFVIPDDVIAYQEDDIMTALSYVRRCAVDLGEMPISICIPLGTSMGSHTGGIPLSQYINRLSTYSKTAITVAAGNEGNSRHHFSADIDPSLGFQEAELRVGENEPGFTLEFWGNSPTSYTVTLLSPSGEEERLLLLPPVSQQTLRFVFLKTIIFVNFILIENQSGRQLIMFRFVNPAPGIWKFTIQSSNPQKDTFHMWLPVTSFLSEDTYFLRSSPFTTVTSPGNANNVITATAYNYRDDSIYLNVSRGFNTNNIVTPTFAAPGVDIIGPLPNGRFTTRSGTSIAAAHTCGAAALFLEWAIVNKNIPFLNGIGLKNYLIRGTRCPRHIEYPNPEWGYGILDLYNVFESLT